MASHSAPGRLIRGGISLFLVPLLRHTLLNRRVTTKVLGVRLSIDPGVFHPSLYFSTTILARYVRSLTLLNTTVLDMGTGSGALAIHAAAQGASVTAVDISSTAVGCARRNIRDAGLDARVEVLESDLFTSIPPHLKYDYIFWNPPFYPRPPLNAAAAAWNAGEGYSVIRRFAGEALRHLADHGKIVLIFSSDMRIPEIVYFFRECGLQTTIVESRWRMFEEYQIHEFSKE